MKKNIILICILGQYYYQYDGKFIIFFVDETGEVALIRFEIA